MWHTNSRCLTHVPKNSTLTVKGLASVRPCVTPASLRGNHRTAPRTPTETDSPATAAQAAVRHGRLRAQQAVRIGLDALRREIKLVRFRQICKCPEIHVVRATHAPR